MGTRSMIFYKKEDGTLKGSYFHFDGYVEHTGVMLLKHYNSYDKAKALIDFSPANSSIKESIEKMIEEDSAFKDASKHYQFDSLESLIKAFKNGEHSMIEFVYVFANNSWAFTMPEPIGKERYQVFFMDLEKYCLGEGIKFND